MQPAPPSRVHVRPVRTRQERRAFLGVPARVFAGDPAWVPPLAHDERCKMEPGCHPFFEHGKAEFWIAWRGEEPVGRISAQINDLAARPGEALTAHFGMLDALDDAEVYAALVEAASRWARAAGAVALEGPYSLSLNEEFGVLVDGFDHPPVVMMAHTRPYHLARLEELGFTKAKDFYHWVIVADPPNLARARNLFGRVRLPEKCTIRASSARTLRRDFHRAMQVYNAAWRQQWGFLEVSAREVDFLADRLRFIFDPKLLMLAEREDEVIALCCFIPDYNEITRDLGGRLWPLGWLKFAWRLARRRIKGARLILMGVDPRYHKRPGAAALHMILIHRLIEYVVARGYSAIEIAWVSEDNRYIGKLVSYFDAKHRKTYRVLRLPLD